jgi:hypothetical protein
MNIFYLMSIDLMQIQKGYRQRVLRVFTRLIVLFN